MKSIQIKDLTLFLDYTPDMLIIKVFIEENNSGKLHTQEV